MLEVIVRKIVQVGNRYMIPVPVNSCRSMGLVKGSELTVIIDEENLNIIATPVIIRRFDVPYRIVGYERRY